MAIASVEMGNKIPPKMSRSKSSIRSRNWDDNPVRTNYGADITTKRIKKIKNCIDPASPYLKGDKVQMVSQITDKRVVHRKATELTSSFPLAVQLYKASSDEFKLLKKGNKKVRKSVLTLPNEPAGMTQACTVSDMNDSEYYSREKEYRKTKNKTLLPITMKRKLIKPKDKLYDSDDKYCSQLNINIDRSSIDLIKCFEGDGQRAKFANPHDENFQASDVWNVLRNINRFQFRPSPALTEDSIVTLKKRKAGLKRCNNQKDARFIQTSHTEEYAYISTFEVENKSTNDNSQCSSCDCVTVIDKRDEFCNVYREVENKINKGKILMKVEKNISNNNQIRIRNKRLPKGRIIRSKENISLSIQNGPDEEKRIGDGKNILRNKSESFDGNTDSSNFAFNSLSTENTFASSIEKETRSSIDGNNEFCSVEKGPVKVLHIASDESAQQQKGITKVVVCKGQDKTLPKQIEIQRQKFCLTDKITKLALKTTEADIKRKLDKPRVSRETNLGKKQHYTPMLLNRPEHPSINYLDNHRYINEMDKQFRNDLYKDVNSRIKEQNKNNTDQKVRKVITEIPQKKQLTNRDKKENLNQGSSNTAHKIKPDNGKLQHDIKTQMPTRQFKDKMLKFLYKKRSSQSIMPWDEVGVQVDINYKDIVNKVDKCTDTFSSKSKQILCESLKKSVSKCNRQSQGISNHAWSKAKWASEFVDNVMNKIRTGVYYTNDSKSKDEIFLTHYKEASTQAVLATKNSYTSHEEDIFIDQLDVSKSIDKLDLLKDLGFDASIPALEIKSFDKNKIDIRHCLANITIQFDVMAPEETDKLAIKLQSASLVPVGVVNSEKKLFKYQTTIVSTNLPAEICSIIPKIIRKMNTKRREESLQHEFFVDTDLSFTKNPTICEKNPISLYPQYEISSEIRHFLDGRFVKLAEILKEFNFKKKPFELATYSTEDLLPDLNNNMASQFSVTPQISLSLCKSELGVHETRCWRTAIFPAQTMATRALAPYYASQHQSIETPKLYEFSMTDIIRNYYKTKAAISLNPCFDLMNYVYGTCNNSLNVKLNIKSVNRNIYVTITNWKMDSLQQNLSEFSKSIDTSVTKSIKYFENLTCKAKNRKGCKHISSNCTHRKKTHMKLNKKCKSVTNITELNYTCSLSKIMNIEDFFQLIGSKSLSCVFDITATKKILSSLLEMQNWISEINSRQALLVLLLANKKDTPNLMRLRPLVLQGIAVNRITLAKELDMEIEVIERENMMYSKCEAMSYLPASAENQDNLLDELYWIAKTTASDYQKPFDEHSEILIKSLLERRKKLNPSYLRVLARYVGLGLLKSQLQN